MQLEFAKCHDKVPPRSKSARGPGLGELPKIPRSPLLFLQRLKLATSKLASSWGLPKSIRKLYTKEKVGVFLGYRSFPECGVPFGILVMAEASEFKFGIVLGFAKSNYKITPKDKSERDPRLESLKKMEFPINIYAIAETSDFKFGTYSLGLPIRPIRKSHE